MPLSLGWGTKKSNNPATCLCKPFRPEAGNNLHSIGSFFLARDQKYQKCLEMLVCVLFSWYFFFFSIYRENLMRRATR